MPSRTRWITARVAVLLAAAGSLTACGSSSSTTPSRPARNSPSLASSATSNTQPAATIVGRWSVIRTCAGLVHALNEAGLRPLAPVVVGDYFPDVPVTQLTRKPDLCQGAAPQPHSHFFTRDGQFGSIDQNGEQVDDGPYRIVDQGIIHIGSPGSDFRFKITGDKLTLLPVIDADQRRQALAHPTTFSSAGWAVAVAYSGHTWARVNCDAWC
jgi:hypothetical protein